MPNYCQNEMIVTGKKERIKRLIEDLTGHGTINKVYEEKKEDDIQKNIHEFIELLDDEFVSYEVKAEIKEEGKVKQAIEFITKNKNKEVYFINVIPEDHKDLLDGSWYNNRISSIGTKWYPNSSMFFIEKEDDEVFRLHFDTAWSPSLMMTRKIAEKYKVYITHVYEESGAGIYGVYDYNENGDIEYNESYNYNSNQKDLRKFQLNHFGSFHIDLCSRCGEGILSYALDENDEPVIDDMELKASGFTKVDDKYLCKYCYKEYCDKKKEERSQDSNMELKLNLRLDHNVDEVDVSLNGDGTVKISPILKENTSKKDINGIKGVTII